MSSTAAEATSSSNESLQQQSKQRKTTLVSKILKRTTSVQSTASDPKQSLSRPTIGTTVTFELKNNDNAGSLSSDEIDLRRNPLLQGELQVIAEDTEALSMEDQSEEDIKKRKAKRANMVKKSIHYFEDRSNRSMSEDNLYTRRKNLAVHLGIDETVSMKEVQKINTYCLPVPSSALPPEAQEAIATTARNFNKSIDDDIGTNDQTTDHLKDDVKTLNSQIRKDSGIRINDSIEETDDEEESKTKNLAKYLGMKDGVSASIASQGTLSDGLEREDSRIRDYRIKNSVERKNSGNLNCDEKSKSMFSKNRTGSITSPTKRTTLVKLTNSNSSESKRAP